MKEMESLIMSLMSGDTSLLTQQLSGLDLGSSTGTVSYHHTSLLSGLDNRLL